MLSYYIQRHALHAPSSIDTLQSQTPNHLESQASTVRGRRYVAAILPSWHSKRGNGRDGAEEFHLDQASGMSHRACPTGPQPKSPSACRLSHRACPTVHIHNSDAQGLQFRPYPNNTRIFSASCPALSTSSPAFSAHCLNPLPCPLPTPARCSLWYRARGPLCGACHVRGCVCPELASLLCMTCVNVNITHYPPSVVVYFLISEETSLRYLRLRKPPHRHPFAVGSVPLSSMVMYYYLKSVQTHPLSTRSAHHQPFLCPFCRTEKVMLLIDLFVRPIEQPVSTVCGLPIAHR